MLARRVVKEERWIRAARAYTEVKRLVKVESGSIWGSGVSIDSEVCHPVLIINTIAEPRRKMPGIRGYAGVIGHQHKGTGHRAGIPEISGLIDGNMDDAVEGLCDRACYEAGWRWPDVECCDFVLKSHCAGLRTISLSYRRAGSLGMGDG